MRSENFLDLPIREDLDKIRAEEEAEAELRAEKTNKALAEDKISPYHVILNAVLAGAIHPRSIWRR